jgi:hypothetical protein
MTMGAARFPASESIFLRKHWVARDLLIDRRQDWPIVFDYGGDQGVRVELRRPMRGTPQEPYGSNDVLCHVELRHALPANHLEDFECFARNEPPPGSRAEGLLAEMLTSPVGADLYPVPHEMLRPDLRAFLARIEAALFDPVVRTVRVLRWRVAGGGPHAPLHQFAAQWSFDGQDWHALPTNIQGPSWSERHLLVPPTLRDEVHELVRADHNEPVAHELFREAWELRLEHRKASLAVGIAALEVGAKQALLHFAPHREQELAGENAPHVMHIIRTDLPTALNAQGRRPLIGSLRRDLVFREIQEGVELRNRIVHRDNIAPTYERLISVLEAVRDFVWLFDAYRGHDWALENIRPATRSGWALIEEPT